MRMSNQLIALLGCCLIAGSSVVALGQDMAKPAVGTKVSPAASYGKLLDGIEKQFVSAAEAMPADKYGFKPSVPGGVFDGVRSFGDEVKHVTEANYYFFGSLSDADAKVKSESIAKLTSKDDIVKALKDSLVLAHTYVSGITDENDFVMTSSGTRGGTAALALAHMNDHYGQMCVYLRMNGIVPPASRKM